MFQIIDKRLYSDGKMVPCSFVAARYCDVLCLHCRETRTFGENARTVSVRIVCGGEPIILDIAKPEEIPHDKESKARKARSA